MQNANLPQEVRPAVKKLGELAVQDALALLNQLPPTLKTDITTLKEVEAVTRQLTQIFGQTLAQGWTREIVQTRKPSTPHCLKCAMTMRKVDYRSITKLGMFGTYQWRRAYYVCPAGHGGLAGWVSPDGCPPGPETGTVHHRRHRACGDAPFDQIPRSSTRWSISNSTGTPSAGW